MGTIRKVDSELAGQARSTDASLNGIGQDDLGAATNGLTMDEQQTDEPKG